MLPALSEAIALPPGTVARVERVNQPDGSPVPERFPHFHGLAELVFVHHGSGSFISEIGEHRFGPRMLLYAPAMAIHDFAFDDGARAWTLVQFDALAADPHRTLLPRHAAAAGLEPASLARAGMILDWLADGLAADGSGHRLAPRDIETVLAALLLAIRPGLAAPPAGSGQASHPLSRFRPLLQQLLAQPGKAISLADAATMCALSAPYFSRMFKQVFGAGFAAYQNQFRLQQAARLLATSDAPVSQIAYQLGFRSHAYFSQRFRAMFGTSPSDYQNQVLRRHHGPHG